MCILDINNKNQVERYNNYIKKSDKTSILQTIEWNNMKKEWKQEIVFVEKNGEIKMSAMILIKKLPLLNKSFLYCPRGPIGNLYDVETLKELMKEINVIKKKYKAFMIRFDPECEMDEKLQKIMKNNKFIVRNKSINNIIQPRYNLILELNKSFNSENELFKNFSSSARRNIRLAIRKGCEIEIDNSIESLEQFYKIHKVTGIRDNFVIRSFEYYKTLLESYNKDTIKIFKIKHGNDILASSIAIKFCNRVWYMAGASSDIKRDYKASYLIQYAMIKWSIETECKYYELGGVYKPNSSDSIYEFKRKFCINTSVTQYIGEIDKCYDIVVYILFVYVLKNILYIKNKIYRIIYNLKNKNTVKNVNFTADLDQTTS